jgi:membrane protease YdiL (CAAX protease family)
MKKSLIFLSITFLLSWPIAFLCFALGGTTFSPLWMVMAIYFMFTPMIGAAITQKLIFKDAICGPLGVSFKLNRWFVIGLVLPPFLVVISTGISLLLPNVSFTHDPLASNIFTFFGNTLPAERLSGLKESAATMPVHPFFLALLGGTLAGLTVNGLAGFGEELGWRGLFQVETAGLGFWKSSWLVGIVWGIWHAPFIIFGYNYPGHPIAGVFMMILLTLSLTPIIGYIRIRSKSVIAASIMHGSLNGTAIAPAIVLIGGDSLLVGITGMAGIITLATLNIVLALFGNTTYWHNQSLQETPLRVAAEGRRVCQAWPMSSGVQVPGPGI